jgi:hypothetical protein
MLSCPPPFSSLIFLRRAGLSLSGYLLRSAAVEVWLLAQSMFSQVIKRPETEQLTAEERDQVRYTAPGGVSTDPRDVSDKGQLQWYRHGSDGAGIIWYIDERSDNNALRLTLGKVSYDVRYTPQSNVTQTQNVPVAFQSPRHRDMSKPIPIERGELKQIILQGQIKSLAQVRAAKLPAGEDRRESEQQ